MIDWGILRQNAPVDIAGNFARGYDMADKIISQIHERNALGHLAQNPDDPAAMAQLWQANPQMADHMERRSQQRQAVLQAEAERQRQADLGQLYNRDPRAAQSAAIGSGDFDLAKTFGSLDEASQKRAADFWEKAGPVAYQLRQKTDPAERQALWQQAKPILQSEGIDGALLDKFDPTNDTQLDAAITTSQKVSDLIEQQKITWHQQGDQPSFATDSMGHPVGSQNPYANSAPAVAPAPPPSDAARGTRNNNPLNLTKSGFTESQDGYAGTDGGGRYARFSTPEAGEAAGQGLLQSYLRRGFDTPSEIINRWAPASENGQATANYVAYVSRKTGIAPGQKVSPEQLPAVAHAMAEFENGRRSDGHTHPVAPHVMTKAEFDNLPSGTPFVAPDGSRRIKP